MRVDAVDEELDVIALEERCVEELEDGNYEAAVETATELTRGASDWEDEQEYRELAGAISAMAAGQLAVGACMLRLDANLTSVELDFRAVLAQRLAEQGEFVLAAATLDGIYDEDESAATALLDRAGITRGQLQGALNERMRALLRAHASERPESFEAAAYEVKALLEELDTQADALQSARRALEHFGGVDAELLLAHALDVVGEVSEARRLLSQACSKYADDPRPPFLLSESHEDDDPMQAARYLELAYERRPDPMLLSDLCFMLEESEQYDKLADRLEAGYPAASEGERAQYSLRLVKAYRAMQKRSQMTHWFWVAAKQRGLHVVQWALSCMAIASVLAVAAVPPMAAVWTAAFGLALVVLLVVGLGNKDSLLELYRARWG